MSLVRKAVRSAALLIISSMGARAIGVAGTLIITRYLAPDVLGEVALAHVIAGTATVLSSMSLSPYVIVKADEGTEPTFHVTCVQFTLATILYAIVLLLTDFWSEQFESPNLHLYLGGMIVAGAIRRVAAMPMAILTRQMRFRPIALSTTLGEFAYVAVSVGLVIDGWGGNAIVMGNIVQASIVAIIFIWNAGFREWLTPCRPSWNRLKDMFRFGAPLAVASLAHHASRTWDKALFSRFFGPHLLGLYHLGYRLADIPAVHVGVQISDVLLPSMIKLPPERRPGALVRSCGLIALAIFPMAVGLGTVSETLIGLALNEEWQGVAPFLTVLACISVFRPIGWVVTSYLLATDRTRLEMLIGLGKITVLLGSLALLSFLGPLWACASAGIAFGSAAVVIVLTISRLDGIPIKGFVVGFVGPLLACLPLAAAVFGARHGLRALGVESLAWSLVAEVAGGAIAYVPAAFFFAPTTARDFLGLVRKSFGLGGAKS